MLDLQKYRKQGKSADILMPLPNHWKGYTLEDAAQAVHNEVCPILFYAMFDRISIIGVPTLNKLILFPFSIQPNTRRRI